MRVAKRVERSKQEGDGRSPVGVFKLGAVFGTQGRPEALDAAWTWRSVKRGDVWVDDPESARYNTWVASSEKERAFTSAEELTMYDLAVVIEHNTSDVQKGAGSAIFLHTFATGEGATAGCTSMPRGALLDLLGRLETKKNPVFIQVVDEVL